MNIYKQKNKGENEEMNLDDYISIKEAQETLGISAVGLDNNIKKKDIKKHYYKRRAYILKADYEVIKSAIELNGRVKNIKKKDDEELELKEIKEQLERENEDLKRELESLNNKVSSTSDIIEELKKDKSDLKDMLEDYNNNLRATQQLLANEQELHRREKERRIELEDRLKNNLILLEDNNKVKEEIELNLKKKDETIEELAITLENERISKEVIIKENEKFKNMKFKDKLKFLFS